MHAAVIHHIGTADRLSVHPVFHELIIGYASCLEKLHHERCILYKFTSIFNWLNISDLIDKKKKFSLEVRHPYT